MYDSRGVAPALSSRANRIVDDFLAWLLIGIALVIAELVTGTFYLLFLGIAAFIGAGVAYVHPSFWVQAIAAAIAAVIGVMWVQRHRRSSRQPAMPPLDVGQSVVFEHWTHAADRTARVKYRNALWDARVESDARGEAGEVLHIVAVEGSTLVVARAKRP